MKKTWIVFRFEYGEWLKNKSFRITTLIFLLSVIIASCIPTIYTLFTSSGNHAASGQSIVAVSDPYSLYEQDFSSVNGKYQYQKVTETAEQLQQKVKNGDYHAAVMVSALDQLTLIHQEQGWDSTLQEKEIETDFNHAYQTEQLKQLGLSQEEAKAIIASHVQWQSVNVNSDQNFAQTFALGYCLLFVLYMAIVLYGQLIAMAVAREKSTHTMETLITSAKPTQLIFGKVFAACCAGLTQFLSIGLIGYLSIQINKPFYGEVFSIIKPFLSQLSGYLFYFILFFLLGFFSYAFLYAAAGSVVSRTEDVSSVITPLMIPALLSFFLGIFMLNNPSLPLIGTIGSFIPFLSPTTMFLRIVMGNVAFYEILISVAINLITIILGGLLSARIYKRGVLMYGARKPKHKQTLWQKR